MSKGHVVGTLIFIGCTAIIILYITTLAFPWIFTSWIHGQLDNGNHTSSPLIEIEE